jgi:formylglycine-generating enzyme required for sulfatase activity
MGLGGGLAEWQLDAYESYRSACWAASPVHDSICWQEQPALRSLRGGSWPAPPTILASAVRAGADPAGSASFIGARCAYPAEVEP